jgi:hypothetical protein
MEINCWTDASYSQYKLTSIVAFKINDEDIKTVQLEGIKNTQAEILGIEYCIINTIQQYFYVTIINIYTDCQHALKQDYSTYNNQNNEKIIINLIKVKGHQKIVNMQWYDLIFKQVDQKARKTLRNL